MKITFIGLLLLCLGVTSSFAQTNYSVKGKIADTVSNSNLINASVSVIAAKDSILQKFTRVKDDGTFTINNLNKGKFILVATYPGYADFVERFTLDSAHTTHNFGTVSMLLKERLLKEVIVKGKAAAIKIKGDTTEFNPAAYNIQPNSKVEDLLKQLPGIEVDKDGKITAQGQTVKKVLVDGEEFFGDDPTLVTKNLRADMVDKVQLYDKKSDQAAFTGIDDGVKDKTINIKLKEDKKNGYFGKLDGGIGTDGYYQGQALFNRFKGKQKFSVYGTLGNNGKTGLGWEDNNKYGGGSGMEMSDDGGFYFFSGGGDDLDSFSGRYDGEGKPIARTGGAHFDTKWNGDKESINVNYKIGSLTVDGTKNIQQLNNFPGNVTTVNTDQTNHNYLFRQKLDLNYQVKIDSMQNLKVTADGTLRHSDTKSSFQTQNRLLNGNLTNTNDQDNSANVDGKVFNASAFYTKKFKKKSRTLSVNFRASLNESDSKGFLKSTLGYYNSGKFSRDSTTDQYKANKIQSTNINTNITYTEPLAKDFTLALSYAISVNNATNDRRSFNKPSSTAIDYSVLDSIYSSDYKLNQLSNQGGAVFNIQKQKFTFNFGTKIAGVKFKQIDEFSSTLDLTRNFTNWYPQASFQYKFTKQSSIRLSYNGNTSQPSIDQIQPVRINNDRLNIQTGNADLKPSFTNRYNISYNSYKVISNQYIWISGSYSTTSNPIVTNAVRDTSGIVTYKPSNLKNHSTSTFWANSYFERKIPGIDINAGFELSANGSGYYNFQNDTLNKTKSYNYSGSIRLSKYKEKKYDAWISAGPTYTINSSSIGAKLNNNGRGFNANGGFNIYLPGKFQVGSDGNYTYNAPTKFLPDQDFRRFLLNANVSRTFFKDALKASISGNDLLNQNTGYNRTGASNIITQERYTTIRRYFMFSLTWDFNKVGGGAPKK